MKKTPLLFAAAFFGITRLGSAGMALTMTSDAPIEAVSLPPIPMDTEADPTISMDSQVTMENSATQQPPVNAAPMDAAVQVGVNIGINIINYAASCIDLEAEYRQKLIQLKQLNLLRDKVIEKMKQILARIQAQGPLVLDGVISSDDLTFLRGLPADLITPAMAVYIQRGGLLTYREMYAQLFHMLDQTIPDRRREINWRLTRILAACPIIRR